jgi:hypothetical protein
MSKILGTLLIGLMLMVSSGSVCAGPHGDARAAAERGDFATALRLWHPLAEQGKPPTHRRSVRTVDARPPRNA